MPLDKQPTPAIKKPITPALSSRFRNTRTPVAPRLAGSAPASPAITTRKDIRANPIPPGDDLASISLNDNITPRSGARLSRTGTDSPGTPSQLRRPSATSSVLPKPAVRSPTVSALNTRTVATTVNHAQGRINRRASNSSTATANDETTSKFFYAGDVRPIAASTKPIPKAQSPAITTIMRKRDHVGSDQTVSPSRNEDQVSSLKDEKFFRANELSSTQTPRARPVIAKQSSSTSTSSFRAKSPAVSRQDATMSPRMSPQRTTGHSPSRPGSPMKHFMAASSITSSASPSERRNSIGSNSAISGRGANGVIGRHKKAASVSTITKLNGLPSPALPHLQASADVAYSMAGNMDLQQTFSPVLASPETISPRSTSLNSSKTVETSSTNETEMSDLARIILAVKGSNVDSSNDCSDIPSKPSPLSQAQVEAANARRERKVLDLEISNSSLLAINKTLERELRKQSAEIRRFRRLSRNGRLSFAPTNRSVSAQSMLSALSEHPEDEEQDIDSSDIDEDEESGISSGDDENLSDTDSITARSRRRAREERRLMLDLSKHQQLLIDSQKLSQSIRKCVNLTDDLIKDGKRALEYKVGIGDVKLGGRVLTADEFNATSDNHEYQQLEDEPRRGLLSPSLTQTELQEANLWLGGTQLLDSESLPLPSPSEIKLPLEKFQNLSIAPDEPG